MTKRFLGLYFEGNPKHGGALPILTESRETFGPLVPVVPSDPRATATADHRSGRMVAKWQAEQARAAKKR